MFRAKKKKKLCLYNYEFIIKKTKFFHSIFLKNPFSITVKKTLKSFLNFT